MIASKKIKPGKVYESIARRPEETDQKRVIDVTGRHQFDASYATNYVSLPREPWDVEAAE